MNKILLAFLIGSCTPAHAGFPPTTSKGIGDATDITTFKYQFPGATITHTGTTASITYAASSFHVPTYQIFLSGSGTYTTPTSPAPLYLEITMVGGGGGGGESGSSGGGGGTSGGTTSFGTSLLSCTGGSYSPIAGGLTSGGSCTANSPAIAFINSVGAGGGGQALTSASVASSDAGGYGGASPFGGAGAGGSFTSGGGNAQANTGSGGGGGGVSATGVTNNYTGVGGGAGGYLKVQINSPSSTYSYSVGAAGSGGSAGANGAAGGSGAAGQIIVIEHYQ